MARGWRGQSAAAAIARAKDHERAAELVERVDMPAKDRAVCITNECGPMVVALGMAGKLQGLDRARLAEAAAEWDILGLGK